MFERSPVWSRAAILLAAIATERRQLAENKQELTFPGRHRTDPPVRRGNPVGWGHMQTCMCKALHKNVQSSSASQKQWYICQKFWDHCLCDLQPVLMRCGCAGLFSIQKLSQLSRNPRLHKTLQV